MNQQEVDTVLKPLRYNLDAPMLDEEFMRLALQEAEQAAQEGEVPVGAVAVVKEKVIARNHNRKEQTNSPTAHAEILVMDEAAKKLGTWRLSEVTLYCTLEPCPMCAGAMIQARLRRLVFGAKDTKGGAAGSVLDLLRDRRFNHCVEVLEGVMADECAQVLQKFFARRRLSNSFES